MFVPLCHLARSTKLLNYHILVCSFQYHVSTIRIFGSDTICSFHLVTLLIPLNCSIITFWLVHSSITSQLLESDTTYLECILACSFHHHISATRIFCFNIACSFYLVTLLIPLSCSITTFLLVYSTSTSWLLEFDTTYLVCWAKNF